MNQGLCRARSDSEVSLRANRSAFAYVPPPSLAVAPSLVLQGTSEAGVTERIARPSEIPPILLNPQSHYVRLFCQRYGIVRPGAKAAPIMLWYWVPKIVHPRTLDSRGDFGSRVRWGF